MHGRSTGGSAGCKAQWVSWSYSYALLLLLRVMLCLLLSRYLLAVLVRVPHVAVARCRRGAAPHAADACRRSGAASMRQAPSRDPTEHVLLDAVYELLLLAAQRQLVALQVHLGERVRGGARF